MTKKIYTASEMGKIGGARNTPAQNAARAENAKHAGRKRTRYELTFWGGCATRYKRHHLSLQEARETARKVYNAQGWDWENAHAAIIYGPNLPEDGLRV